MKYQVIHHARLTSTMDACRAAARSGAAEGWVVYADEQTAGRGQRGHAWYSPPNHSLYVSVLLRPALPAARLGWLTMTAALAVRDAILALAPGLDPKIKWFNDILLDGRKAGGILVEGALTGEAMEYAALGIGLNLDLDRAAAPGQIADGAISLREAAGAVIDRDQALRHLLDALARRYGELRHTGPAREYASHLLTLGQHVRIKQGDAIVSGLAQQVEADGSLVLATPTGAVRVWAGSVT